MNKVAVNPPFVLRYVYAILAVVAIAVSTVLVSLYVAQQRELETRNKVQFTHLDSVEESAELARETRELRDQVHEHLTASEAHHSGAADIRSVQIGYSGVLQSMRSRLWQMSTLVEESDDPIFALTLQRLVHRFDAIDRSLRSAAPTPEIITAIDVLGATIEQYDRLHQIAADRELQALSDRQLARPRFLGILFLCLALGTVAAWYLLRSLRKSLQRQVAAELALAESQERLHHIQKLDALGRLVGGIAHDFNNWLTVILGHAGLLRDKVEGNERLEAGLDEISQAGQQAASLTQQLLAFSRRQRFEPRVLDLNELVRDMEDMLHRVIGKGITLSFSYADDLSDVELDPNQVQQVILNLINNARDAMPDGGLLSVTTEKVVVGPEGIEVDGVPDGEYARLTVSDTGIGMSDETRQSVFEPFFTTKEKGQGTGLGLAMVHGIVTGSNGHLFVESLEGTGSRFIIYFPRAEQPDVTASDATEATSQDGLETVLIVEDNDQVRLFVETGLTSLGYRVLSATGGSSGLDICRDESAGIDVILSDVVMPETSGPRFMAAAMKLQPDAVPIYMSAYTKDEVLRFRRGNAEADIPLISKPFEIEALSRLIREQLDNRNKH